jgi:ABC-2 type transport system permease protein
MKKQLLLIQFTGLKTIVFKESHRFLRIWLETLLPPVINMTLYLIIFGKLLVGPLIGKVDEVSYLAFITPGLIMMAVIMGTFMNVGFSFFSARFNRSVEEMLVSPLNNLTILSGYLLAGILRGLLVGSLVALIALLITDLKFVHPWLTLFVIIISAAMFGSLGFYCCLFCKKF